MFETKKSSDDWLSFSSLNKLDKVPWPAFVDAHFHRDSKARKPSHQPSRLCVLIPDPRNFNTVSDMWMPGFPTEPSKFISEYCDCLPGKNVFLNYRSGGLLRDFRHNTASPGGGSVKAHHCFQNRREIATQISETMRQRRILAMIVEQQHSWEKPWDRWDLNTIIHCIECVVVIQQALALYITTLAIRIRAHALTSLCYHHIWRVLAWQEENGSEHGWWEYVQVESTAESKENLGYQHNASAVFQSPPLHPPQSFV